MLKLNDTSTGKHEVGNSANSNRMEYASLKKFGLSRGTKSIHFSKLKLFYERDECLLAIQFILKEDKEAINSIDNNLVNSSITSLSITQDNEEYVYTDPKILGPIETIKTKNLIDEVDLTFGKEEEIYLIRGTYAKNKIIRLGVYTTLGQFMEIGKSNVEYNFQWDYYFNLKYFDGFIIGWDEHNINYLSALIIEKPLLNYDERHITLSDTTNQTRDYNIEPIYLTSWYGKHSHSTKIEDQLTKGRITEPVKDRTIYLSEITVYYDQSISRIDVEYTNRVTEEKTKISHIGYDYSKDKSRKVTLQIPRDDIVNYIKVTYDNSLQSLYLKTISGKFINCVPHNEGEYKEE